ncbi:hypothetical protein C474_09929 [Halogeometricum pallidum JCM 14848]|uniref:Uncharacterized protein n=1 Tax=Halogeometricum pallidum JCM 14848 TaxID=1227487 RepID=M0D6P5_HALPD|nr:hypothetical protein [Halogeometricum pallidum]ELZ31145.1 hypothetical protein C474_09929 [Halogeometricum pallidum JCM 14848]
MSRTTRAIAIGGALLGGAVSSLLYPDALLAATAGLCWGLGCALAYRERETWTNASRDASLANAVPSLLLSGVAIFGIHAGLAIPDSLRWALVVLLGGAILAAVGAGIALGRRGTAAPPTAPDEAMSDGAD